MNVFYLFSLALCVGTAFSNDYITILVSSYKKSSTCNGPSSSRRMCRYVIVDSIGHCAPLTMQSWRWGGGGLQLVTYWDPLCSHEKSVLTYKRGCVPDIYEKGHELTQFLDNYPCYASGLTDQTPPDRWGTFNETEQLDTTIVEETNSFLLVASIVIALLIFISLITIVVRFKLKRRLLIDQESNQYTLL